MAPKKSLGQNFLTSPAIARGIVDASGIGIADTVLEIGPGKGILTRILAKRAKKVIAIEKDNELAKHDFGSTVTVIESDIRDLNIADIPLPDTYHVVANIPYYITGEIIRLFLTAEKQPKSMTLLVQKEVAERIVARNGKESVLSLSVKAYGIPKYVRTVKSGVFFPKPKVDSAVLHIGNISRDFFKDKDETLFFSILKAGFNQKRKKLLGNLKQCNISEETFNMCNISTEVRAEQVRLEQWVCLVRKK